MHTNTLKYNEALKHPKGKSLSTKRRNHRIIAYAFLLFFSVLFLAPFIWMLLTSVKSEAQAITYPPVFIPKRFEWENFKEVFQIIDFLQQFYNTVFVTVLGVFGTVISCAIVGYGFARIPAKGKSIWFVLLLSTMMLPQQVTMIPVYLIFAKLHWVNTYLPLIVPNFLGNAFFIFLLRQFFKKIPRDLEEAAILDGCGIFGTFWRVFLPLSKPALASVAILSFMGTWNDFMWPLIYLNDVSKFTLALGLQLFKGQMTMLWGPMMAACTLIIIPMIVLFFSAQRYFIQGITFSGIKG
jgi:multiple sugar transport system permease protein